jgi:hypothetical protein
MTYTTLHIIGMIGIWSLGYLLYKYYDEKDKAHEYGFIIPFSIFAGVVFPVTVIMAFIFLIFYIGKIMLDKIYDKYIRP